MSILQHPFFDKAVYASELLVDGQKPSTEVEPIHEESAFCYAPDHGQYDIDLFGKYHPDVFINGAVTENFNDQWFGVSPEMHPSTDIDRVEYPASITANDDDITVILIGTAQNVLTSNGWGVTRDPGGSWSFTLGAGVVTSNKISCAYVQGSPLAQHTASLSGTYSSGDFVRLAGRKKGGVISVFDGELREKVSTNSGQNGVTRSGSTGWRINSGPTNAGHGFYSIVIGLNTGLTDDEIWNILDGDLSGILKPASTFSFTTPFAAPPGVTIPVFMNHYRNQGIS